jgi:tetratricopeptide (TPR) repeat protein
VGPGFADPLPGEELVRGDDAMMFLHELKRRRVVRAGLVYCATGFVVLQAADILVPALGLPPWAVTLIVVLLALGLPVVLVLAWLFDITPAGVERTAPLPATGGVMHFGAAHRRPAVRRAAVLGAATLLLVAGGAFVTLRSAGQASDELDPSAIVVLPFRVSADATLSYLGEGMVDLLAAKLTGEGGPRAVDSRASLRLWERATGGGATPIDRQGALALARGMAAGQLLLGEMVGTPGRLTISAAIHDVAHGAAGAPVSVTGAADSLPWLVDRLVAGLLSVRAGEGGSRLSLLTSASLPALRAYLAGKQAYRGGRFGDAAAHFRRAVEIDSTFALAGLELILAGTWTDGTPVEFGRRVAWLGRDRLTPRDRRRLELGNLVQLADQLRGWEALATEQPDDAEAWLQLGETLLHGGPNVGMAGAFERALHAFERSVAVDSIYAPALFHAIEISARNGDTVHVRRLARVYFHRNAPESGYHSYIGWRTALAVDDQVMLDQLRSTRLEQVPYHDLWYITRLGQTDALPVTDVEVALDAWERRAATGADRAIAVIDRFQYLLTAGRPAAAERLRTELFRDPAATDRLDLLAVRAATFLAGDAAAANAAARRLAERVAGAPQPDPDAANILLHQVCALEERRLAAGDVSGTARTLGVLDRILAAVLSASAEAAAWPWRMADLELQVRRCGAYLDAWRSWLVHGAESPELARGLTALEAILSTAVGSSHGADIANLVAARLHGARGDAEAALRAARRRSYYGDPWLLAPMLHEEARFAEQTGDIAGAARAWEHYLHLRGAPEDALIEEVSHARARLQALMSEGEGP